MAVAEKYRLPHSRFLAWDSDDRDKAIEWHLLQQETCPNCGTRPEEWDPTHGGHHNAYKPVFRRCRGCEVRAGAENTEDAKGRGVHVTLTRTRFYDTGEPIGEVTAHGEP